MEGQVPQAHSLRVGHPGRGIGFDKQFQNRVTLAEHPQVVVLGRAVNLPVQFKPQLVDVKRFCFCVGFLFVISVIPSRIERGDVVIIKTEYGLFLKRVIGVPGDTVQIRDGRAYVNGEMADMLQTDYAGIAITPILLADGEYFVLGDNRDNSLDSRYPDIGVINKRKILRKAIFLERRIVMVIRHSSLSFVYHNHYQNKGYESCTKPLSLIAQNEL